jgi:hypothetical protein
VEQSLAAVCGHVWLAACGGARPFLTDSVLSVHLIMPGLGSQAPEPCGCCGKQLTTVSNLPHLHSFDTISSANPT